MKRVSCEVLARYIQSRLPPGLVPGGVFVGSADHEDAEAQPQIRVLAQQWTFDPYNVADVDETLANVVLVETGWWEGNTEIRILGTTQPQREAIEEAVLDILVGDDELSPGIVTALTPPVKIRGQQTSYQAPCTWAIATQEWRDEFSFDDHRYAFLELETVVPALGVRGKTYTINDLIIEFEASTGMDTVTPATAATPAADPGTESFSVDSDGHMVPV